MFKPTLSDDYDHVYSKDPAVDQSHPDYDPEKWAETGDGKWLPLKPGAEPVRFRLRHLSGRARAFLSDRGATSGYATMFLDAVSLALVKITNGIGSDGKPFDVKTRNDRELRMNLASDETLDVLYGVDSGGLVVELGSRVLRETYGNPT